MHNDKMNEQIGIHISNFCIDAINFVVNIIDFNIYV